MKTLRIFASLIVLSLLAANSSAQDEPRLTEEQKVLFQERVKQKVEEFQSSLSKLVNDKLDHNIRSEEYRNILVLFIGEGETYSYYDYESDERITREGGVRMETSSKTTGRSSRQRIKNYIRKLYNPETHKTSMPYTKIVIESVGAVRVDNIERVGDHYECIAYFKQKFIGYRDGKIAYSDVTGKKIKCFINSIDLPTGKKIFEAKLGDIYVTSTE